jgi:hypothetical protein
MVIFKDIDFISYMNCSEQIVVVTGIVCMERMYYILIDGLRAPHNIGSPAITYESNGKILLAEYWENGKYIKSV